MKKSFKAVVLMTLGALALSACSSGASKAIDNKQSPEDSFTGEVAASTGSPTPAISGKFGEKPNIEAGKGEAPKELKKWIISEGKGRKCSNNAHVLANYQGQLWNGTVFDSTFDIKFNHNTPFTFSLSGGVIEGWMKGLIGVRAGSRVELVIPPELGYKDQKQGSIPPNSTLVFAIDVLDCVNPLDNSRLKQAKKMDKPPAGITVTGDLGKEPKITISKDFKVPDKMTLVVLYEGSGPVIGPDDFPVFQETDVLVNDPKQSRSTYSMAQGNPNDPNTAKRKGEATVLPVKASSEQLGDHKILFIGQKIGTRLLVISPARNVGQSQQPALVSVIDFSNRLSPKAAVN